MAKLEVLGPRRLLPEALRFLQGQGVVALREPPSAGAPGLRSVPVSPGDSALGEALRAALARLAPLRARLPPPAGRAQALPDPGTPAFQAALDELEAQLRELEERRAALLAERQSVRRLARLLRALVPLSAETPTPPRARAFGLALRRERGDALALLASEVARLTAGGGLVRATDAGEGELAVLLIVPSSRAREVRALLFEQGVEELQLPGALDALAPARALVALAERERALPGAIAAAERARDELLARLAPSVAAAERAARAALARLEAAACCGETGHAFVVWGWAPRAQVAPLSAAAAAAFAGAVSVSEFPLAPGEEREVPVVLSNPRWLAPFELLLALVPLPRYGSVDPTAWMALFYPLFFGLMLGDLGFGALAMGLALAARWRGWGGPLGRRAAVVVLACGAWAALFGLLFGEAFGALGEALGLHPLLLDRRTALLALLGLALAFGLGHLAVGLALGAWQALRDRHRREALARAARLLLLGAAAVAAAAALGLLPRRLAAPAAGCAALCAAAAAAAEGPMALLEAVLSLGNVLSYARLMALGVASAMLAEVANGMPAALPGAGGVALALALHAVNFTMGAISPAIAALRLQLVEFLDKFYCEGGRPYRPLALG
ncbi:ATPase [Anaeromyxobacter diazotrophicus]|nr:ATPase [Anaeromyxobacter diazotrophicus]